MATPRGKKTKAESTASTGLALPPSQPTAAAKTTPAYHPQPVIDPALQNQTATAAAASKQVVQAAGGYLNSATTPTIGSYAYPQSYYANYYPGYQAGTAALPYYQQYAQAYQTQQYGGTPIATPTAAYPPPIPTATATSTATSMAATAMTNNQRLLPTATGNAAKTASANANNAATAAAAAAAGPSLDTSSVAQLTDALGSAGVDIRAEEEAMARDGPSQQYPSGYVNREDRSKKQNFLDPVVLAAKVKEITSNHSLEATPDAQTYIALALQFRLTTLIKQCVSAVDHRIESNYTRPPPLYPISPNPSHVDPETGEVTPAEPQPMWNLLVRRDVAKQLAALEKMDREEETRVRRRRQERNENESAGLPTSNPNNNDGGDGEDGEPRKKKKKKDGPGVTAKNMSEEVRVKMSDIAANAAGAYAKKYSWMQAGATTKPAGAAAAPPKPAAAATTTTTPPAATAPAITTTATATGGFVRPFVTNRATVGAGEAVDERKIGLADLMFVVGKERGHGAGRGSARTWSVAGW